MDLQFTASFVHGPFLHERDNWAVVTESELVFLAQCGEPCNKSGQLSQPRHETRH